MTTIPSTPLACAADGAPALHIALATPTDLDTQQLVDYFQQLDPYGRRVALTLVAGLARLKGGAS